MKPTLKEKLIALQTTAGGRRGSKEIAAVLPEIEAAISHGVPRQLIHKTIVEDGIEISFQNFAKTLYRLRKKTATQPASGSPANRPAEAPAPRATRQLKSGKRKP